jgi:hypothetical protein
MARAYGRSVRTPISTRDIEGSVAISWGDQSSIRSGTYRPPSGARPSNSAVPSDAPAALPRVEMNRAAER